MSLKSVIPLTAEAVIEDFGEVFLYAHFNSL